LIRRGLTALLGLFVAATAQGQAQTEFTRAEDLNYGRDQGAP